MEQADTALKSFSEAPARISEWRHFWKRFIQRKIVVFGLVILALLILTAIFADVLAPYDPYLNNPEDSLQQPSRSHWLGTDNVGRDTLSRLIYGSRNVLLVGFVTVAVAAIIGTMLGLLAGYFGGILN
ncbi:MAG: hypothetical protein NUV31_00815, partial [Dehalococcoidales bacterium]|nr:hypothetical protein [Dehalococcoidales bacterium]